MLASVTASMLNQNTSDLGIPNRIYLKQSPAFEAAEPRSLNSRVGEELPFIRTASAKQREIILESRYAFRSDRSGVHCTQTPIRHQRRIERWPILSPIVAWPGFGAWR